MKHLNNSKKKFCLSAKGLAFVKKELTRYETKRSAVIPCLRMAQQENGGWVSEQVVSHLSEVMGISTAQIKEVLSFYTMYNTRPVGKFHVQVCCNLSCAMNGAREVLQKLCKSFNVGEGDISTDGFTFSRVECLGACDQAPVAQVGDRYIGPLQEDTAVAKVRQFCK